ncbi:hypothetical protein BB560_004737 [Smittium megazygosporum]|uniref:Uncharacterized protein n=1 Tax=Smittium megazygosporum TaxID=133381 RepID=A0A2T9Z8E6_9FUNG|nr:hypothetical protein BB560_004737 [Smittium megazygosporum]
MAVANFWGMFLIVSFMGVGLVGIPRNLLMKGKPPSFHITYIESQAPDLSYQLQDAELALIDLLHEFSSIPNRDDTLSPYYPYFKQIEAQNTEFLQLYRNRISQIHSSLLSSSRSSSPSINLDYLSDLNKRIRDAGMSLKIYAHKWHKLKLAYFFYTDIGSADSISSHSLRSTIYPYFSWSIWKKKAAFLWYIYVSPYFFRLVSYFFGIVSFIILESEVMESLHPRFSIIRLIFSFLRSNSFLLEWFFLNDQVFSIFLVSYMCISIYSSVTRLKLFGINMLYPSHNSSQRSLLSVGSQFCRLMIPLCNNFLDLAFPTTKTEFNNLMGKIDVVPIFGSWVNKWTPFIVLFPAFLAYFRVYSRIMKLFKPDLVIEYEASDLNYDSNILSDSEFDSSINPTILEGRALLREARSNLESQFARSPSHLTSPSLRARDEGRFNYLFDGGLLP